MHFVHPVRARYVNYVCKPSGNENREALGFVLCPMPCLMPHQNRLHPLVGGHSLAHIILPRSPDLVTVFFARDEILMQLSTASDFCRGIDWAFTPSIRLHDPSRWPSVVTVQDPLTIGSFWHGEQNHLIWHNRAFGQLNVHVVPFLSVVRSYPASP